MAFLLVTVSEANFFVSGAVFQFGLCTAHFAPSSTIHRQEKQRSTTKMTSPTRKRAVNDDRLDDNDVALLEAVERGDIDSVCRLVKAGARLDVAYDKGKTPLHVAVSAKAVHRGEGALGAKMLRFLCENGADINAVDKAGWTPLHDAFFLLVASAIFELSHASLRASLVAPSDTGRIPYTPIRLGVRVLDTLIDLGADTRCVCKKR